ncbi:hypothetical protein OJ996_05815 [Luteolibacter sp. GHJ8]|uniref:Uncharacterized protein n=1 Tax=Luteolibacter rhizosphaerae TaxID=2989719 RepID=A0ABT3FZQ8_9BACT|nr:hypothetical protein [Luteolibacter rhizosphaerae]MCW1913078.1 hypothetical protein [Luteolibacter rhizosphaerae]
MSSPICEALLEMHYFRALVRHFKSILGADQLQILKPTQQREKWLGFDQGFVRGPRAGRALEGELKDFIHSNVRPLSVFRAFFLQFKVVDQRRSRRGAPAGWTKPWYSADLSTSPDKDTKISQHETLVRLSQLPNTEVAYACPMLFGLGDLVDEPDPATLRTVDVRSAPSGWLTSGGHRLAFQDPVAQAFWCSEPIPAKDWNFTEALERLPRLDEEHLRKFMGEVRGLVWEDTDRPFRRKVLPPSLIVVGTNR